MCALKVWPHIKLDDDIEGNQFVAVIFRRTAFTEQVTEEILRLLEVMQGEMTRQQIQSKLGLKHAPHFRASYLIPALESHFIEMTIPEKPKSRLQRYRLTQAGKKIAERSS